MLYAAFRYHPSFFILIPLPFMICIELTYKMQGIFPQFLYGLWDFLNIQDFTHYCYKFLFLYAFSYVNSITVL